MTPKQWHDEATRVLGARDGFAHALISVRSQIDHIAGPYAPGIHPRHVRKLAERERRLRPLRELEERFLKSHRECQESYKKWSALAAEPRSVSSAQGDGA
jgi:hypothetical protein